MKRRIQELMPAIIAVCFVVHAVCAQPSGPPTIGGFDLGRGGSLSLSEGGDISALRGHILDVFPNAQLTGASELTPSYLETLDIVFLASKKETHVPIVGLSISEQDALRHFIEQGGGAILTVDSDRWDSVNESLLDPIGMDSTGNLIGIHTATVLDPAAHPVTSGPFGLVRAFDLAAGGWIESLGASANSLANISGGRTALATIDHGAFSLTSGGVVVLTSVGSLQNSYFRDPVRSIIRNAIVWTPPPPCYPDCDSSTGLYVLDIFDFLCFQNSFVLGEPYACECEIVSGLGVCDIFDFLCFQNRFVAGCP